MTPLDVAQEAVDAYPVSVFPELTQDELNSINQLLKENGYSLTQLSAHNMRYRARLTCKKIWELQHESN